MECKQTSLSILEFLPDWCEIAVKTDKVNKTVLAQIVSSVVLADSQSRRSVVMEEKVLRFLVSLAADLDDDLALMTLSTLAGSSGKLAQIVRSALPSNFTGRTNKAIELQSILDE